MSALIHRLRSEVLEFATGGLHMGEELVAAARVYDARAVAASVLCCARIAEATTAFAVAEIGLRASVSVLSNLGSLTDLGLLPRRTAQLANAIRMLSNDARHVRRRLIERDADAAMAFVEPLIRWFFCSFPLGPRLPAITRDGESMALCADGELSRLAAEISDTDRDIGDLAARLLDVRLHRLLRAPAVGALLAEALLDRGPDHHALALAILQRGIEECPHDVRLRQLTGLYWSRQGQLRKALEWLEPLLRDGQDDEETCGISGGAYKRLWRSERSNSTWLRRALRAYERGWRRSRNGNPYLGINVATLELLRGNATAAAATAAGVRAIIEERQQVASRLPGCMLGYWDQLTLAEATLVEGDVTGAGRIYRTARESHPEALSAIEVATQQANEILDALGGVGMLEAGPRERGVVAPRQGSTEEFTAATNPWDCEAQGRHLPAPEHSAADLLAAVARLIHSWPDSTPSHMVDESERCRRLAQAVAGYPLLPGGVFPVDDPFEPLATEALAIGLAFDNWPPLARHSLRAEILWLDRLRFARSPLFGIDDPQFPWLRLTLAWLVAGASRGEPCEDSILFDVLHDAEVRDGELRKVRAIAEGLIAAARMYRQGQPFPAGFGRVDSEGGLAQHLWWARLGKSLNLNRRGETPPPVLPLLSTATMEVKFHRIQSWLTRAPTEDAPLRTAAVRGASQLLEIVMSQIRHRLLTELGVGNILIDGGGRLRMRCSASAADQKALAVMVRDVIDNVFQESHVRHLLVSLITRSELEAYGNQQMEHDLSERLRELAWELIPPLSVRFGREGALDQMELRVPVLRRVAQHRGLRRDRQPERRRRAWRRSERALDMASRIRVEFGVLAPRMRLLDLRLGRSIGVRAALPLPRATDQCWQILSIDLNRVGDLFTRERGSNPEHAGRRSFRLTAHWLLAVRKACEEVGQLVAAEVLIIGGDDLLVASRSADADLLGFAQRLHEHLNPLNEELPPCDGISFCAGLARQSEDTRRTSSQLFDEASFLEKLAKQTWREDVGIETGDAQRGQIDPARHKVHRIAGGRRGSVIVVGLPGGDPAPQTITRRQVANLDLGEIAAGWQLAAPLTAEQAQHLEEELGFNGIAPVPPFEIVLDEINEKVTLIIYDSDGLQPLAPRCSAAQAPCCLQEKSATVC